MKEELSLDTKDVLVEFRAAKNGVKGDHWPLAELLGGIDKISLKQRRTKKGLKTTIEFTSPDGRLIADNMDRAQKRRISAAQKLEATKAAPKVALGS